MAAAHGYELDMIFVDDGSTDDSWEVIRAAGRRDPRVRGIRFRRNFGKAAALSAGFAQAARRNGHDARRRPPGRPARNPPLPGRDGRRACDVVSGWKQVRHDPWHKVLPSRVFNWHGQPLTGVRLHDHNCGMKCYRREVLDEVRLYGELHRFVPVLAAARGFRVGEVGRSITARAGSAVPSTAWRRFVKGFLDLLTVKFLTGFGQRPQHVLGTVGLALFLLGRPGWLSGRGNGSSRRPIPAWCPSISTSGPQCSIRSHCCSWAGSSCRSASWPSCLSLTTNRCADLFDLRPTVGPARLPSSAGKPDWHED